MSPATIAHSTGDAALVAQLRGEEVALNRLAGAALQAAAAKRQRRAQRLIARQKQIEEKRLEQLALAKAAAELLKPARKKRVRRPRAAPPA